MPFHQFFFFQLLRSPSLYSPIISALRFKPESSSFRRTNFSPVSESFALPHPPRGRVRGIFKRSFARCKKCICKINNRSCRGLGRGGLSKQELGPAPSSTDRSCTAPEVRCRSGKEPIINTIACNRSPTRPYNTGIDYTATFQFSDYALDLSLVFN